jgi:hypothetical protein
MRFGPDASLTLTFFHAYLAEWKGGREDGIRYGRSSILDVVMGDGRPCTVLQRVENVETTAFLIAETEIDNG